jgi:hypothetical protein
MENSYPLPPDSMNQKELVLNLPHTQILITQCDLFERPYYQKTAPEATPEGNNETSGTT